MITVLIGVILSTRLMSYPFLQLDIGGGLYDNVDQSIYSQSKVFNLYALENTLAPGYTESIIDPEFHLAVALIPSVGYNLPIPAYGSVKVNNTAYLPSSSAWQYGVPPAGINYPLLGTHGIYETYYMEFTFAFDSNSKAVAYDTQYNPGGFQTSATGDFLYQKFDIDVTQLDPGYELHFDLYRTGWDAGKGKRLIIYDTDFAPYSHDAYSGNFVPDSSTTIMLLGIALCGIGGLRSRMSVMSR